MSKKKYLEKAIEWTKSKPIASMKSRYEGYDDTKVFTSQTSDVEIQPDISYITHRGAKHYTDIALKKEDTTDLVTRWKLLAVRASLKNGKLHLLAPKGHKMFTQKLVSKYNINAIVHSI